MNARQKSLTQRKVARNAKAVIGLLVLLFGALAGCGPAPAAQTVNLAVSEQIKSQGASPAYITLTAQDVVTAQDIEGAIRRATDDGRRAGTVVLDGSQGPFSYAYAEGNDYTINIFVPGITLRGANNAILQNGEGIFFDALTADNVTIKNLTLNCAHDCIIGWGLHRNVRVLSNRLYAANIGIQVAETDSWQVNDNLIQAGGVAIHVIRSAECSFASNHLSGEMGILLDGANSNRVVDNAISGARQGVALSNGSSDNIVQINTMVGVERAGILVDAGAEDNAIHQNRVLCVQPFECQAVRGEASVLAANSLKENMP